MKTYTGFDGDYMIMSEHSIDHHKRDGTTVHYMSTIEIKDFSDKVAIEKIIKEQKEKKRAPFGSC